MFEKKKLILPLISATLIIGVIATVYDYRAHGYGNTVSEGEGREDFNELAVRSEHELFNSSFSHTQDYYPPNTSHLREIRNNKRFKQLDERSDLTSNPARYIYYTIFPAYKTPVLVLMPSDSDTILGSLETDFGPGVRAFPVESGYVFSKDRAYESAEWWVKASKLQTLSMNASNKSSNWTLDKFRTEADDIRSREISNKETEEFIANQVQEISDPEAKQLTGIGKALDNPPVKEIGVIHFVPALVVNSVLYYLISGLVLTGIRGMRRKQQN